MEGINKGKGPPLDLRKSGPPRKASARTASTLTEMFAKLEADQKEKKAVGKGTAHRGIFPTKLQMSGKFRHRHTDVCSKTVDFIRLIIITCQAVESRKVCLSRSF